MNPTTHQAIATLDAMRLPELQARYLEVLGAPTRCPNRGFLVRKISEALAANEANCNTVALSTPDENAQPAADPPPAPAVDIAVPDEVNVPVAREPLAAAAASSHPRGRFRGMTIEELQRKYVEIVGRPSSSEHKGYLVWKIREAEKGHVPVGPIDGRSRGTEPVDVKVLPLRIEAAEIARIDEAWRKHGIRNRTVFLRSAIEHYLAHLGTATSDAAITE